MTRQTELLATEEKRSQEDEEVEQSKMQGGWE